MTQALVGNLVHSWVTLIHDSCSSEPVCTLQSRSCAVFMAESDSGVKIQDSCSCKFVITLDIVLSFQFVSFFGESDSRVVIRDDIDDMAQDVFVLIHLWMNLIHDSRSCELSPNGFLPSSLFCLRSVQTAG